MRMRALVRSFLVLVVASAFVSGQVVAAQAAPVRVAQASAGAAQCTDAHLRVRVHFDGEASGAGQRLAYVDFQNTGAAVCSVHGAPGVSLVSSSGSGGTRLGRPADHSTSGAAPAARLAHGQSARADLQFAAIDSGGGAYDTACKAVQAAGFRISAPHSARAVFVSSPQYACSSSTIHWGSVGDVAGKPIGCAATSGGIPAGAVRKQVADVDGDWNPDTEWITPTRFGITTASGATATVKPDVAGGGYPSALSFVLQNTSTALTVIAGSRDAQLFRFTTATCTLKPVLNSQGHQYRFDLTGHYGDGVACTDPDRNGVDQITGTRLSRPLAGLHDGDAVIVASTVIGIHGLSSVTGATRSRTSTWPADKTRLDAAATITCRGVSISRNGITPRHA